MRLKSETPIKHTQAAAMPIAISLISAGIRVGSVWSAADTYRLPVNCCASSWNLLGIFFRSFSQQTNFRLYPRSTSTNPFWFTSATTTRSRARHAPSSRAPVEGAAMSSSGALSDHQPHVPRPSWDGPPQTPRRGGRELLEKIICRVLRSPRFRLVSMHARFGARQPVVGESAVVSAGMQGSSPLPPTCGVRAPW